MGRKDCSDISNISFRYIIYIFPKICMCIFYNMGEDGLLWDSVGVEAGSQSNLLILLSESVFQNEPGPM